MAIKPPSWAKDAVPTLRGWVHPKTGEILVGGSIKQRNIDEYFGKAEEADVEVEELDLDSMTKAELIETAEDWEVDVDTKGTKAEIKAQLEEELF